jgi:hypothetical protein
MRLGAHGASWPRISSRHEAAPNELRSGTAKNRSRFQKARMSLEALYRVVKFSYKQLVTMRLLPLHACTTLAMSADELEGTNVGSLLIPKR